jgi:GrpB-like predicted nucleotidyltransferase (UPF0157 family)
MTKDSHPFDNREPITEEQLRAVTIGELKPLSGRIPIVDYDPRWPELFEREADRIRRVLGPRARRIEHVGSTSVLGLAAKPIIDILLVVTDPADEASYVTPLEAHGYTLVIREPDWFEHRCLKGPDTNINLHVHAPSSTEIERNLLFRDWLRAHDDDRELYERTKRDLSTKGFTYIQEYADAKTGVITEIMARAQAART